MPKTSPPPEISANSMPRTRRLVAAVVLGHRLHARERGDALPRRAAALAGGGRAPGGCRGCRGRAGRREPRNPRSGIGEQLEARGAGIQAEQPQRGGPLAPGGDVDGQPFDGDARSRSRRCASQIRPKESDRRGVAIGRAGDGRPAVLSVAQKGAREGRGEAGLQVGFGAQFRQVPFGELAAQEQAEALAEYQAPAAAAQFRARRRAQIDQKESGPSRRAKRSTAISIRAPRRSPIAVCGAPGCGCGPRPAASGGRRAGPARRCPASMENIFARARIRRVVRIA